MSLELDIGFIGAALQISVFEYIYKMMMDEVKKLKKTELNTRDYHSGIKLLTQVHIPFHCRYYT